MGDVLTPIHEVDLRDPNIGATELVVRQGKKAARDLAESTAGVIAVEVITDEAERTGNEVPISND